MQVCIWLYVPKVLCDADVLPTMGRKSVSAPPPSLPRANSFAARTKVIRESRACAKFQLPTLPDRT